MASKFNSEFNYRYQVIGHTPWQKIKTLQGFLEGRVRAADMEEVSKIKYQAKIAKLKHLQETGLEHEILEHEAEILETKFVTPPLPLVPTAPKLKIPLSLPYPHPAGPLLALPTVEVSEAIIPALETKFIICCSPPRVLPKPNIPLSPPKVHAAKLHLPVPTDVISALTTPVLETRFVGALAVPPLFP